jgi:hypothetical protein
MLRAVRTRLFTLAVAAYVLLDFSSLSAGRVLVRRGSVDG